MILFLNTDLCEGRIISEKIRSIIEHTDFIYEQKK